MDKTILKSLPYFTKDNLSIALQKKGENLNYWIKKLLKEGELMQMKKGLYISTDVKDLMAQNVSEFIQYKEYMANLLRYPSYISLEYVLSNANVIPEAVFGLTSITLKSSRIFNTPLGTYQYRSIKETLFNGYVTTAWTDKIIKKATPAKALFDYLYLKSFLSGEDMRLYLLENSRLNWEALTTPDYEELKSYVYNSQSKKMRSILRVLENAKIL